MYYLKESTLDIRSMSNVSPLNRLLKRVIPVWGIIPLIWSGYIGHNIFIAYYIAGQQDDWVKTKAVVAESWISREVDEQECHFLYTYAVEGRDFWSSRYAADGRECVGQRKFKRTETIEVYYSPENPRLAVVERLKPSIISMGLAGFASALLFLLGCVWIVSVLFRVKQRFFGPHKQS